MKPVKSLLLFVGLLLQTPLFSQFTIVANKTTGCDTLTVGFSFSNAPVTPTSVRWEFGDGQDSQLFNPTHKYSNPGSYSVKVVINGTDSVTKDDAVQVGLTPQLDIQHKDTLTGRTKAIRALVTNGPSPFSYNYNWTVDGNVLADNSGLIVHTFDTTGVFTASVIATDANGCSSSFSKNDISVYNGIVVPNVFTPNHDSFNEIFKIASDGNNFIKFQLFSRAGLLVYRTTAKTIEWDGRMSSGQDVPEGLYYYIVETVDATPPVKVKGFIYIYR